MIINDEIKEIISNIGDMCDFLKTSINNNLNICLNKNISIKKAPSVFSSIYNIFLKSNLIFCIQYPSVPSSNFTLIRNETNLEGKELFSVLSKIQRLLYPIYKEATLQQKEERRKKELKKRQRKQALTDEVLGAFK